MTSILQFPQAMNASSDLQIWNNAAFDSEDTAIKASSWSPVKSILVNQSESLDSFSSKENQSPVLVKTPVPIKIPAPAKPLHVNGIIGNSQGKPTNLILKQNLSEKGVSRSREEEIRDEQKIDAEIEEIQMEINRLNSRLETLWLEKAEQKVKALERRGRVVPAKFMEPKQSAKVTEREKKIEEPSSMGTKAKVQRRGLSLGPSEIAAGVRRGVSLGPSEIFAGVKARQLGKQDINITPAQPIQNRRKSCFWKLQDIDEEKETKGRRATLSVSPKSRKTTTRAQPLRQAATTVGPKKGVKKEDGIISSIQPKKLFKDGEKSVPANKKQLKPGRVVASRYNQHTENSAMRKRSLPENDKDDGKRRKSHESLQEATQNQGIERRMKKKWEIPSEIVIHKSFVDEESLESFDRIPDLLPQIRTIRCTNNSPRDSGPAKRVAELVGRKSYFSSDENSESAVCQALSFEEDAEEN